MPPTERVKRQLLELGILTLITVVVWIGHGVYSALTEPAVVSVSDEELRPLTTEVDVVALDQLQSRLVVSEEDIENIQFSLVPSFSPSVELPESTASASPSANTP